MKCTINTNELKDLLLILKKNTSKTGTEYDRHIRLLAKDDALTLTATDGDVTTTLDLSGTVEEPGKVLVSIYDLDKILTKLKKHGGVINVMNCPDSTPENPWAVFTHPRLTFRLKCMDPTHYFPALDQCLKIDSYTITAGALQAAAESCLIAASGDTGRPNLCGVFLRGSTACATDGHRLRRKHIEGGQFAGQIVRSTAIEILTYAMKKLKVDEDTPIEYAEVVGEHLIRFVFPGGAVTAICIMGTFPDFRQGIRQSEEPVKVKTSDFMDALDLVSPVTGTKTKQIRLTIEEDATQLTLYASDPASGEGTSGIDIEPTGSGFLSDRKAGFNADYLSDVMKDLDADVFYLDLVDTLSPVHFRGEGAHDDDLWVVMPMLL